MTDAAAGAAAPVGSIHRNTATPVRCIPRDRPTRFAAPLAIWQNRGSDPALDPLSSVAVLLLSFRRVCTPLSRRSVRLTSTQFRRIVAVKIRLKRLGKIRAPYYRIVVADSRTKRDGRVIEEIGKYHPTEEPSFIEVDSERAQHWLSVGAQPTEQVRAILKLTGDWGRFKGDKDAVSTVKVAEPKPDFEIDSAKKSVIKPKAEKKAEEPVAEAPADADADSAADAE